MIKKLKKVNINRTFKLDQLKKKAILLIFLAVFIGGNIFLSPFALRLDLTKGKAYSLSPSTKKVIRNFDKSAHIDFYVSSELPTRMLPLKNDVIDLLREYKRVGGNKINLSIVDPKKDEEALQQAQENGIPELQFSQVEQDKYALTTSYFGIVLSYDNKKATLPQATELGSLEYNITAALYKLSKKEAQKIGVVGYPQALDAQQDPISTLRNILSQQFTVETVDVSTASADPIDSSVKSLLIFDTTRKEYSEGEVAKIEQYLNAGGKAIFFADGISVYESLQTMAAQHKFFPLFEKWGIVLQKNLVLSSAAELVNFGNEVVSYMVPYPLWVKTSEFNLQSSYFSNINSLTFPWTSSLNLSKKQNMKIRELVRTNKESWQQTENFVLNPQAIPGPQKKDVKQYILAAESEKENGGQMVVVASSHFPLDRYLSRTSGNLEFVLNVLNDLASGGDLSGIRQRVVSFYPLPTLAESQKDMFKYANILILPALFGLYGFYRLAKRK